MKKQYIKPTMKVIDLPRRSNLLVGSYPGEVYAPGISSEPAIENHLA